MKSAFTANVPSQKMESGIRTSVAKANNRELKAILTGLLIQKLQRRNK